MGLESVYITAPMIISFVSVASISVLTGYIRLRAMVKRNQMGIWPERVVRLCKPNAEARTSTSPPLVPAGSTSPADLE